MQGSNIIEKEIFDASSYEIGVVVADFNTDITGGMLKEAVDTLQEYKIGGDNINVVHVPGSVEIPLMLQTLAQTKKYDGLIALGAVIKGESAHFDYVAKFVTDGVLRVQLDSNIPIGFGVLTTFDHEQAARRFHVGADAAHAAVQLVRSIEKSR